MTKLRKIFVVMLIILMSTNVVFAENVILSTNDDTIIVDIEDVMSDPELSNLLPISIDEIKRISEDSYLDAIMKDHNQVLRKSRGSSLNLFSDKTEMTEYDEYVIANKYGLEMPEDNKIIETKLIMPMNAIESRGPIGPSICVVSYVTTKNSFSIYIKDLRDEGVDAIKGTLSLYGLNRNMWTNRMNKPFEKNNVKNGLAYRWYISSYYVKEYFEYDITILDGFVQNHNNKDKRDKIRYNFEVGVYGSSSFKAQGGERHHFVSAAALNAAGFNSRQAYAVRMLSSDHRQTSSYGGNSTHKQKEIQYLQNQNYEGLLQFEVNELKRNSDSERKYPNLQVKYNSAIIKLLYEYERYFGIR